MTSQPLGGAWSPESAAAAIDASGAAGTAAAPATTNPFQNGQRTPLIDPVRHRVEKGETAYSLARLYGVSVTAPNDETGLVDSIIGKPFEYDDIANLLRAYRLGCNADLRAMYGHDATDEMDKQADTLELFAGLIADEWRANATSYAKAS